MKNKILNLVIIILALVVTLSNLTGNILHSLIYNIEDLPEGEFMFSSMSQDTSKTLKIYKVNVPSYGMGIRGELTIIENGEETTKNIYWQTYIDNATVSWIDNVTLQINGEIINTNGDVFDCRTKIQIPEATAKNKGLI